MGRSGTPSPHPNGPPALGSRRHAGSSPLHASALSLWTSLVARALVSIGPTFTDAARAEAGASRAATRTLPVRVVPHPSHVIPLPGPATTTASRRTRTVPTVVCAGPPDLFPTTSGRWVPAPGRGRPPLEGPSPRRRCGWGVGDCSGRLALDGEGRAGATWRGPSAPARTCPGCTLRKTSGLPAGAAEALTPVRVDLFVNPACFVLGAPTLLRSALRWLGPLRSPLSWTWEGVGPTIRSSR